MVIIIQESAVNFYIKGEELAKAEKNDEAIKFFDKAIEIEPKCKEAWKKKADVFFKQERYCEADKSFDKAIEIDPKYKNAWSGKGRILIERERYLEAICYFERALEIDKKYKGALYNKALCFDWLDQTEKAKEIYDEVLNIEPIDTEIDRNALHNKGLLLLLEGKIHEAEKCFDKAIDIDREFKFAWNSKGNVFFELKNFDKAIEYYTKALEFDPNYVTAIYNIGISNIRKKEYEAAESYLSEVIDLDPKSAYAYNALGILYSKKDEHDKSIAKFKKAIDIDPNFIQAHMNLTREEMKKESNIDWWDWWKSSTYKLVIAFFLGVAAIILGFIIIYFSVNPSSFVTPMENTTEKVIQSLT